MKRRALVIGYVWPEPNSSAAGRHMMEILQFLLQQHWQVTFASAAAFSEHQVDLPALGINVSTIELNADSFDKWVSTLDPQLVIFDRYFTEEQYGWRVARCCPSAMRVIDTEDLHCLREGRQRLLDTDDTGPDLNVPTAYREIAAIFRSDLSLIISRSEMNLLQSRFPVPANLLHYFPFLAAANVTAQQKEFVSRTGFVFIGTIRHRPNLEAVRLLKKQLWPMIRKKLPDSILTIAGSYMTREVTQMHKPAEGFNVVGHVSNLADCLSQHRVMLAPLTFGAGLKGKLIDAMEQGLPSVTTPVGAEGISEPENWPGYCGCDLNELAEKAVELYENEAAWTEAQQQGYVCLEQNFDSSAHHLALNSRIEAGLENLEAYRRENFIGQMLMHHSMASTEYMSRWIACKNKNADQVE
jgi:glycosyltransferase involved in cell wall biosynthesis